MDNISAIIDVSDAIMVARGDLGAEIDFELLPAIQDEIVALCRDRGVPVIIATHMLESMIEHPMPTRAEVTDIAHAAMTGADATMLSGETASGLHPLESLAAMNKILRATEKHIARFPLTSRMPVHNEREARAEAAVTLSDSSEASAIIVFTKTGRTAREVSKFRPLIPIVAITDNPQTERSLSITYGIHPIIIKFLSPEETAASGICAAADQEIVSKGDKVVLLSDIESPKAPVQSVQVRTV